MKDKILANGPFTVIILDWSKYDGPPIELALQNMKRIGPLAAEMLNYIVVSRHYHDFSHLVINHRKF